MKSTCATSQIMVLAKKNFTAQVLTGTFDEFAKRKRKLNTTLFSCLKSVFALKHGWKVSLCPTVLNCTLGALKIAV